MEIRLQSVKLRKPLVSIYLTEFINNPEKLGNLVIFVDPLITYVIQFQGNKSERFGVKAPL